MNKKNPGGLPGFFDLNWTDWMIKLGYGCDDRTVQYCHPFAIANLVIAGHEAIPPSVIANPVTCTRKDFANLSLRGTKQSHPMIRDCFASSQ